MKIINATLHVSFRRFKEGTILYIDGTDESMPIKDCGLARQIMEAVNARPKVEELIGQMLRFITPDDSGFIKPTISEWRHMLEKAREIETVLGGK